MGDQGIEQVVEAPLAAKRRMLLRAAQVSNRRSQRAAAERVFDHATSSAN